MCTSSHAGVHVCCSYTVVAHGGRSALPVISSVAHVCRRCAALTTLPCRCVHWATGTWRKRRALLVPHTFLYYFGESTAATDLRPHGVIDLELYTDIQVVDGESRDCCFMR